MSKVEFKTIIGLEIHTQLKTKSKMFCSCSNDAEGKEPNSVICPVCLGMPGTLPVANIEALKLVAKIGLALESKIADVSWFDRKHYFYPDLPKGYQISQYQNPFCEGGNLKIGRKIIRFNRVHLEEDAGKLTHHGDRSYVDLNRAGTPLAEIVTEPDLDNPAQAREFLQELRDLLRSIDVSDADMEKGHLRCDANISVVVGAKSSPIVEIKNLNSFKFVEKALALEEKRLQNDFENWPEKQTKTTRGFDSAKCVTYTLREKEEAKDYRYFPEPDLPPIKLKELFDTEKLKNELAKLPQAHKQELTMLGFSADEAKMIISHARIAKLIETANENDKVIIGKLLINNPKARELSNEHLGQIADFIREGHPSNWVRSLIDKAVAEGKLPKEIINEMKAGTNGDKLNISALVDDLFTKHPTEAERFKKGDKALLQFFIGQGMKVTQGSVNPKELRDEIIKQQG